MALRVMAVAPPGKIESEEVSQALNSADPASLFNACRLSASLAEAGIGAWGHSNWSHGRSRRRSTILLMNSERSDGSAFDALLTEVRPNLLLIGAMSICMPGAISCAKRARLLLGDRVCIVLGGWHASETIYRDRKGIIKHHVSSPVRLMAEGFVPRIFDIVVSGEAEEIIVAIGESIARLQHTNSGAISTNRVVEDLSGVNGRWIASWLCYDAVCNISGNGLPTDRASLPPACAVFGVRTKFDVFGGRPTAHVISDTGRGCAYDCSFCSERRSSAGKIVDLNSAPSRLREQLRAASAVITEEGYMASAFIEDSTILGGSKRALTNFCALMEEVPTDIRFGGQLTVDQINDRYDLIKRLKGIGLDYLFIGIETPDPEAVGGMSKDVGYRTGSWLYRTEDVIAKLTALGIGVGCAVLFGLGENHSMRLLLLEQLHGWKAQYRSPFPVSLNWAVQHPLAGNDGGCNYRYLDWAVPAGPWSSAFSDFGEASVAYPLANRSPPVLHEVQEIAFLHKNGSSLRGLGNG